MTRHSCDYTKFYEVNNYQQQLDSCTEESNGTFWVQGKEGYLGNPVNFVPFAAVKHLLVLHSNLKKYLLFSSRNPAE